MSEDGSNALRPGEFALQEQAVKPRTGFVRRVLRTCAGALGRIEGRLLLRTPYNAGPRTLPANDHRVFMTSIQDECIRLHGDLARIGIHDDQLTDLVIRIEANREGYRVGKSEENWQKHKDEAEGLLWEAVRYYASNECRTLERRMKAALSPKYAETVASYARWLGSWALAAVGGATVLLGSSTRLAHSSYALVGYSFVVGSLLAVGGALYLIHIREGGFLNVEIRGATRLALWLLFVATVLLFSGVIVVSVMTSAHFVFDSR